MKGDTPLGFTLNTGETIDASGESSKRPLVAAFVTKTKQGALGEAESHFIISTRRARSQVVGTNH